MAETLLQEAALQPYIHDCQITVHEGRHTYHYHVFFKRHCRLHTNTMLSDGDDHFRGDVAIMRIGSRTGIMNMRGRDSAMADYIITRVSWRLNCRGGLKLPRFMNLLKPVNTYHCHYLRGAHVIVL
ncbi:hypothetical protein JVT61DRAFT_14153 [Boletus reticuloceps]|uniref:Uncharacterized protein n=1 Tax=Boletus reticuloceps TaxID=495285 RepID=A0A8I2YD40_9AGAM|nr:hypothetical protein JVT61DRAFT_14153 [Boletus reticuloceps]